MAYSITHAEARAMAKRARKAAKRRRDAALTRLGRSLSWTAVRFGGLQWVDESIRQHMDAIRRGEVTP